MKNWTNKDNANFYVTLPTEILLNTADTCGLSNGCDVETIKTTILNAKTILEVGAGYGRVIKHIINMGFTGQLHAIERNDKLYTLLDEQFSDYASIACSDLTTYQPNGAYDLILCMWTGLYEFSKDEQPHAFKKLFSLLNKGGSIILDTIPEERLPNNATHIADRNYVAKTPYGDNYGYFPSQDEILAYATNIGVDQNKIERIPYITSTGRSRILFRFTKP